MTFSIKKVQSSLNWTVSNTYKQAFNICTSHSFHCSNELDSIAANIEILNYLVKPSGQLFCNMLPPIFYLWPIIKHSPFHCGFVIFKPPYNKIQQYESPITNNLQMNQS